MRGALQYGLTRRHGGNNPTNACNGRSVRGHCRRRAQFVSFVDVQRRKEDSETTTENPRVLRPMVERGEEKQGSLATVTPGMLGPRVLMSFNAGDSAAEQRRDKTKFQYLPPDRLGEERSQPWMEHSRSWSQTV